MCWYCKALKIIRSCFLGAAIVFVISLGVSTASAKEPLSPEDTGLVLKATIDVSNPAHLAGIHKQKLKTDCSACHGEILIPDDNATNVNQACVGCHGDFVKMAELSSKTLKDPNINPHKSHLGVDGEIGCTACHRGHEPSVTYCVYCHTNFDLPITGGQPGKGSGE